VAVEAGLAGGQRCKAGSATGGALRGAWVAGTGSGRQQAFAFWAGVHPNSLTRLNYVNEWFQNRSRPISVDDVKALQRDHEHEVCAHATSEMGRFCTCWAWMAQAAERRIHVCQGSPCENAYRVHSFG
jgi:hypothetical protein